MDEYKDTIVVRGVARHVDGLRVDGSEFIISGFPIRTVKLRNEWFEDIRNPESVSKELRLSGNSLDIFSFWQRIPEIEPRYPYYHEIENVAAIPITTYEHWWNKQINSKTRNMIRKSEKKGVSALRAHFDDKLVRDIMGIFNESPVRRGKRFWHYGKDFEAARHQLSLDFDRSIFISAYWQAELIGFVKLLVTDRFGMITLILDKMSQRDKSPMNGLIAKAVDICAEEKLPFLTYTVWRRGSHGEFQKRNGFERFPVPRYYLPLNLKGRLAIKLRLHHGVRGVIPDKIWAAILNLRARYYNKRYPQAV